MVSKNNIIDPKKVYFFFGLVLILIIFNIIFGFDKINPNNTDWLFRGDVKKHFLGWLFFQQSEFIQWPIGKIYDYGQYYWSNIILTDSIPVLAIIFKYFPILPDYGQYFGLWFLICLVLQYFFAFKLLSLFSKNYLSIFVFSIMFVISPAMLERSGMLNSLTSHPALMSHWLIISGMYFYFSKDQKKYLWPILLSISLLTHLYLFSIVFAIFIIDIFTRKDFINRFKYVFLVLLFLALLAYSVGFFIFDLDYALGGFGRYRSNLVSLLDPNLSWSLILDDIKTVKNGEHEGFSYLGLGLILSTFSIALSIKKFSPNQNNKREYIYFFLIIAFFIYAQSNNIYLSNYLIFSYQIPEFFESLFNIFRSSGRFMWPVIYSLMLIIFVSLTKLNLNTRLLTILFICIALIQIVDLSPAFKAFNKEKNKSENLFNFSHDIISSTNQFSKIIIISNEIKPDILTSIGYLAVKNKQIMSPAPFARYSQTTLENIRDKTLNNLKSGNPEKETIYIFDSEDKWSELRAMKIKNIKFIEVDKYYLAYEN